MRRIEKITGDEIHPGDVIRSAAMPRPMEVAAIAQRTDNTVLVAVKLDEHFRSVYRVGRRSKVRRYNRSPFETLREDPFEGAR